MVKLQVINRTEYQQFLDIGGGNKPEDIVSIPPKSKMTLFMANEKVFLDNAKTMKEKLIIRKVK